VLKQRVISALILIPIVLGLTYLGGPYFAALVAAAALLAGYEFYSLMRQAGHRPYVVVGLGLIALLLVEVYDPGDALWRWATAAAVMAPMIWRILQREGEGFLTDWALTLVGAVYVGLLAGHLVAVRNLPQGLGWLLFTFAVTWVCDTAAYFVGTWWGKHGFFTHISPHKTWEGAVGGWLAGAVAAVVAGHWLGLALWQRLVLGVVLVLGVTFGDLAESLVKRQVGVKDSGRLIPGHGGMLDRIDSLLFAGVIVYHFVTYVVL
jgi:phosphatidate cytidylyltransferase